MNWFLVGAFAPVFWGVTNIIDKYVIDRFYGGGVKNGYVIVSFTVIGASLTPLAYFLAEDINNFSTLEILALFISGFCYILALFPYMYALKAKDTSLLVPLFQTIPLFNLVLGLLFLGETISNTQIILGLTIIVEAILISVDIDRDLFKSKLDVKGLLLMLLSCLVYAFGNLAFKYGAGDNEFWSAIFWVQVGYAIQSVFVIVLIKSARIETIELIKEHKTKLVWISVINSLMDAIAKIIYSFALFSAPLFLASIVNSFQPVVVFLLGVSLTILAPHLIKEDISKKILLQKIILITAIFITAVAFNYSLG